MLVFYPDFSVPGQTNRKEFELMQTIAAEMNITLPKQMPNAVKTPCSRVARQPARISHSQTQLVKNGLCHILVLPCPSIDFLELYAMQLQKRNLYD